MPYTTVRMLSIAVVWSLCAPLYAQNLTQPAELKEDGTTLTAPASSPLNEDGTPLTASPTQSNHAPLNENGTVAATPQTLTAQAANRTTALPDITCDAGKVCIQTATGLPFRVLPRALSNLYSSPDANSPPTASNIKAFWPLFVFARKDIDLTNPAHPQGWYQVGTAEDDPFAWIQAKDALEWKQALVVSYTHPGVGKDRRQSVLMFDTKEQLKKLVESDERVEQAKTIYDGLSATQPIIPTGLISREPARYVSIEEKFYLLPVIDFEKIDIFDDDTRYLQIAAAIPNSRASADSPDTLENQRFIQQSTATETTEGTAANTLSFDIKFVMDMTGSMGPYITRTKAAINQVIDIIGKKNVNARINYGLVGYRDDLKTVPELEFLVKNFTPKLVSATDFIQIVERAEPAKVVRGDYQEEVFAGINEAINSNWTENSIKFIVLIGDASSHPVGHPQNTTQMDAKQLRELANSYKVNILSLHLKAAKFQPDHALAQSQFSTLAINPGTANPAYIDINADDHPAFESAVTAIAAELSLLINQINQGDVKSLQALPEAEKTPAPTEVSTKAAQMANVVAANALVDYLGNAANPPRDIVVWVVDRDVIDPDTRSLQVRVLLKKRELNDLIQALDSILKAVRRAEVANMQFFDALQGVIAQSTKGEKISVAGAKKLSESGLMPNWINSLPYKSAILAMSNDMFTNLSAEERAALEYEIEAKLQLYQEINENADLWIKLDERDAALNHVYPLSLTALP